MLVKICWVCVLNMALFIDRLENFFGNGSFAEIQLYANMHRDD